MRTFAFIVLAMVLGGIAYVTGDIVAYVLLGLIYIALLKILDVLRTIAHTLKEQNDKGKQS